MLVSPLLLKMVKRKVQKIGRPNVFQAFILYLGLTLVSQAQPLDQKVSGKEYLNKFMKYSEWSEHLPRNPDEEFLAFVDGHSPLSNKLREKWLYQLTYNKDLKTFSQHYQPSNDLNLQCYEQLALYQQGHSSQVLQSIPTLWLRGQSDSKTCGKLFSLLLINHEITENQITQRLLLALEARNVDLAVYLLKQYAPARLSDIALLLAIQKKPSQVTLLNPDPIHSEFYLFGLKQMASVKLEQALHLWESNNTQKMLNHSQQQAFIAHVAILKAMHNHPDAPSWFAKVEPTFYTDNLLDWEIRFALKYHQWHRIEHLISYSKNKNTPCWNYWTARALEEQGQKIKATAIYQDLAKSRNYYGFLSSQRLNTSLSMENEPAITNNQALFSYRSFLDEIKALYLSKHSSEASRKLNDFLSELPKNEKSTVISWIAYDLQWHGKAVYLSSTDELNNQLSLRFPLAYQTIIKKIAKHYNISPALIYAIIRQESAFRDDAASEVGAQGLMQIMPSTAHVIAKEHKIPYSDKKELLSTSKNIFIGTAYLQQLSKHYHQHPILMVAAYNAGPGQVAYWLKNHPPKDIDIWIETLPWFETRNYLKNILSFYAVYQYRLNEKPDIKPFLQKL